MRLLAGYGLEATGILLPGRGLGGQSFAVTIAGRVLNPAYGLTPQIGVEVTFSVPEDVENPVFTVFTDEDGDLATGAAYTAQVAQNGMRLKGRVASDNFDPLEFLIGTVRYAYPENIDPPEIQIRNDLPPDLLAGFAEVIEVSQPGVWSAPGATTILFFAHLEGETYTPIASSSADTYSAGAADSGKTIYRGERKVSSGGDVTIYSPTGITVETFIAAESQGDPGLNFSTLNEGDVVTLFSGGETGNPPPNVSLQLLAANLPLAGKIVSGAAGSVTIPPGTATKNLRVEKTLTSPVTPEPVVVRGEEYGPVTAPSVAGLSNLSAEEQTEEGLPVFYTTTTETGSTFFAVETGDLVEGSLPTGIAADVTAKTLAEAVTYCDAILTPLDDNTPLGSFSPAGFRKQVDLWVLVEGGGDDDIYLVAENITLNLLEAPIITPISGGLNFVNPLLKAPVITPIEGGLNFGD
jgi:hypothetical protein